MYKKREVVEIGGYSSESDTEDLDLVVRLHRHNRALGIDCGPRSVFDNARLDEEFFGGGKECEGCEQEFFPAGHVKSNFLCNLGYGDASRLYPRAPRLEFDEACTLL